MRKPILLLFVLAGVALAQPSNPQIQFVTATPSGSCGNTQIRLLTPGGTFYTCQGGTWGAISGGGGAVSSVFTRTGAVVATSGDYTVGQVTNAASVLNPLSQFASTASSQLFGVISNPTGTGLAVFNNTPTFISPVLGAATGTSLTVTGAVTSGSGSGVAGAFDIGQGTLPSLGTTAVSLLGPASVTSYGLLYPGAAPSANQFLLWGTPSSGISTGVFTGFTSTNLTDTANLVRNQGTNTGTSAMTLDMSASNSAAAFRLPNLAGASSTTAGVESYDTTNKNVHVGANGADNVAALFPSSALPSDQNCIKASVSSSVVRLADSGSPCGAGGGSSGTSVTSATPVTANANSTSDQQMMELTLPAGYFNNLSQPFDFFGAGVYSTQALQTPTVTIKVKLCTVSGCGSGTVVTLGSIVTTATLAGNTNNNWNIRLLGITATTGATGNLEVHGPLVADLGATTATADSVFSDTNTAVSSNIDLTAALFVDFTATFSTQPSTPFNTITQRSGAVMPFAATAAPVTSVAGLTGAVPGQGTDTKVMTAGTVSGTAASLCTDANGGATTSGCSSGGGANIRLDTFANLPGTCTHTSAQSDLYYQKDGPYTFICTATNTQSPTLPGFYGNLTLPPSSWTWDNQGTSSFNNTFGYLYAQVQKTGAINARALFATEPSTPCTITARFRMSIAGFGNAPAGGSVRMGIGFRESSTGKFVSFMTGEAGGSTTQTMTTEKWTTTTAFSAAYKTESVMTPQIWSDVWLRVTDGVSSGNLVFWWSLDGNTWIQFDTEARTNFLTGGPNQIAIFFYPNGDDEQLQLLSWTVS